MPIIEINISNKIARLKEKRDFVVCGNSDYIIHFDFDEEWNDYDVKTARFKYNGKHVDIVFSGVDCPMPVISNTRTVEIGVYAGDLHTSSPAIIPAKGSILCGNGVKHPDPEPDVYNQLLEIIKNMGSGSGEISEEKLTAAIEAYFEENPVVGEPGLTPYIKDAYWWIGEQNTNVKAEGKDGSNAKVTADSIKTALGYVPADAEDVSGLSKEIADQKKALESITLGKHTDGLIYIFVGGQPVGNGLDISGGDVVEPVWGQPVTDNAVLSIAKGQTVMLGVMLDEEPTQGQTITVSSESEYLTFDKTVLTFTPENWNTMQFVAVTAINVTEDVNVSILLSNSDPMLTDTSIFVMLTADGYSVDTTIPDGAHTVTAADFTTASVYQTNYVQLSGYTGEYDNIYVPDTIEVDGVARTPIIKPEAFKANTVIKYVRFAPNVNFGRYGGVGYEMNANFNNCSALVGVCIEGDALTKLSTTFKGCTSLLFVDGLERQTKCVTLNACFEGCTSLVYVQDLSGLTAVTGSNTADGYASMFKGCTKFVKAYGMPNELVGTSTAVNMYSGSGVEYAKIPKGVKYMGYAFFNCTKLKRVDIYEDDLDTSSGITSTTFSGCKDVVVYCNAGTTTYNSLMAQYGSSAQVEIRTFGADSAMPSIVVWGDSISSPNKPWIEWPARLQEKIGTADYLIKNEALAGEHSPSTTSRQGGNAITVDAFTIPADTIATPVVLNTADGKVYNDSNLFSCGGSFNPCIINGVEGVISRSGSTYNFTRLASGESVSVASGTVVTSKKDDDFNNADNIMIFYLNGNAGWDDNADVLLNLFRLAVDHFTAKGGTKYIVIGPAANVILANDRIRPEVFRFEELAATAFGDHWLNLRIYEIENGLEQNGLTASALDIERMEKGLVPASLVGGGTVTDIAMYDGVNNTDQNHPNVHGANTIMLGVYEKGKALGYWD